MKLKKLIKLSFYFSSIVFFYSCASETNIFDATKYYLVKDDKYFQLDKFKVVNVIDNRKVKDSIIGDVDYDNNPMIINRPLTNYLKMSFNSLICKDTTQLAEIPVTVTIIDFFSGRYSSFLKECAYNKFSYLFEYPYESKINKLIIKDSVDICNDPGVKEQRMLIKNQIRDAARMFVYNHFENFIDTSAKTIDTNTTNKKETDTIDFAKVFRGDKKEIYTIEYCEGHKIRNGFAISGAEFISRNLSKYEFGYGLTFNYYSIKNKDIYSKIFSLDLIDIFQRYNAKSNKDGIFVELKYALSTCVQYIKTEKAELLLGGNYNFSIGYNINKYIGIKAGFFQVGYFDSNLGSDYGFLVSLVVSEAYK